MTLGWVSENLIMQKTITRLAVQPCDGFSHEYFPENANLPQRRGREQNDLSQAENPEVPPTRKQYDLRRRDAVHPNRRTQR